MSDGTYFMNRRLAKGEPSSFLLDKEKSCNAYINYMIIRLQKMFHYEGLPDSLPQQMLEYYLLINGTCLVTKVDGKLYAFCGSFGGTPDPYYRPTAYVVANPALQLSKTYDLEKEEGILVRNDPLWIGLYPLMSRFATLMAENMLTIRTADIMLRVMALLSAPDDKTKLAAEAYLTKLEKGELAVIGENRFLDDGVKLQSPPSNNGSYLTQFIELHQYLTGTFYNEVGLNANFNMKRESIGDGESSLNEDSLLPLCDQMLECRKQDVERINKVFGTSITVEFDSSWANNRKEIKLNQEILEEKASQLAEGNDEDEHGDVGHGATVDTDDGESSETVLGDEHDTNEDNDITVDEESERGDADEGERGDKDISGESNSGSDGSITVDVELEVTIDENAEKGDEDGRDSEDK